MRRATAAAQGPSRWGRLCSMVLTALALVACMSLLMGATPRQADVAEAQRLFKAGALAYKLGKFGTAVQAFEQANDLAPNPALLFSAAQALRRQYATNPQRERLDRARRYYEQYLGAVSQGRRRLDAAAAIERIDLLLATHHPNPAPSDPASSGEADGGPDGGGASIPQPPTPTPRPAAAPETSLVVESPIAGAHVSVDGEAPAKAPLIRDLAPGRHRLRVTAAGYRPMERTVDLLVGKVKSLDLPLEELPASVTILAPAGLDLVIDGRPMGTTPLINPIELRAGTHRVVAGMNGHYVFAKAVSLDHGQSKELDVEVEMTTQRIISWGVLGSAGAATVATIGLSIAARSSEASAEDLVRKAAKAERPLTVAEAEDHNAALFRRDNLARVAGVSAAAAAVAATIGLLTFVFDEPQLYGVEPSDDGDPNGPGQAARQGIVVSGSAVVLPTGFAAGLVGQF